MDSINARVSLVWANVLAIAMMFLTAIALFLLIRLTGQTLGAISRFDPLWFCIALLPLMALHEFVHGLTSHYVAKLDWEEIEFGVNWKYLMPFCHPKAPMTIAAYRWVLWMPTLVLPPLLWVWAVADHSLLWLLVAALSSGAGGGDILIWWDLRRFPANWRVQDHPTEPGCEVLPE